MLHFRCRYKTCVERIIARDYNDLEAKGWELFDYARTAACPEHREFMRPGDIVDFPHVYVKDR